ncbi:MAG: hypothetical protein CSA96_01165 [Bacteroidetes bacterium]|nr:MAG: hypothetical protein CSA96_01165 [Bacteroidota bacterium]
MKRALRTLSLVVISIVLLLLLLPLVINKPIERRLLTEMDAILDARLAWEDRHLSFFRHFPGLELELSGLSLCDSLSTLEDTLFTADLLGLHLRPLSLVRGRVHVKNMTVLAPVWYGRKGGEGDGDLPALLKPGWMEKLERIVLERFTISEGWLNLAKNEHGDELSMTGIKARAKTGIRAGKASFQIHAEVKDVQVSLKNTAVLDKGSLRLEIRTRKDLKSGRLVFNEGRLWLNELEASVCGSLDRAQAELRAFDFTIKSTEQDLAALLSPWPLQHLSVRGKQHWEARISGGLGSRQRPDISFHGFVEDGAVSAETLLTPIRNLRAAWGLAYTGLDRKWRFMDDSFLSLEQGEHEFMASLNLPEKGDAQARVKARGELDLGLLGELFFKEDVPLSGLLRVSGLDPGTKSQEGFSLHSDCLQIGRVQAENVNLKARMNEKGLNVEALKMDAFDGKLSATGTIYKGRFNRFSMDLSLFTTAISSLYEQVDATRLLAPYMLYLEGKLSADIHAEGQLGKAFRMLWDEMRATGRARLEDLRIGESAGLEEAMALLPDKGKAFFPDVFDLAFRMEQGRIKTEPFTVTRGQSAVLIDGSYSLQHELDYRLDVCAHKADLGLPVYRLLKGFTILLPASRGRCADNGMRILFNASGSFEKPVLTPRPIPLEQ